MNNTLLVYPDPVQDQLSIRIAKPSNASITISNVMGQTVYAASYSGNSISLSYLPPGIYNLIVTSGENTYTRKIVKQ